LYVLLNPPSYEFYEYVGEYIPDNNEANPNAAGISCESDPTQCDIIGNYLGAQMAAAVFFDADLSVVTQSPVMSGEQDKNYMLTLTAFGGTPPYSWSLIDGALCPGLSLVADGIIEGQPSSAGTFSFNVKVTDSSEASATKSLELAIIGPTSSPTMMPAGMVSARVDAFCVTKY
jgi:hypothetical protein